MQTCNNIITCRSLPLLQTARTVADLCTEGSLCTTSAEGFPVGAPVSYRLDQDGNPVMAIVSGSPEAANLERSDRVSLLVQPITQPARGVAAVALQGSTAAAGSQDDAPDGTQLVKLTVDSCVYYGGLDHAAHGEVVSGDEYRAAEPDLLRRSATDLINTWNNERAEDIYRIVAGKLGVPVVEMSYAEMLWVDRLGMYVRAEVFGRSAQVVRIPFYRPVLDERDARSVVTMASHISWEADRKYTPPVPTATPAATNN
eukprot:GHUV01011506.1.p1 GENE.GHUV01011506.1~~GHUV01011506.1.p1  ORF type:complete len:257 (+),score=75.14 GHUV01011506.1:766-1536(+)